MDFSVLQKFLRLLLRIGLLLLVFLGAYGMSPLWMGLKEYPIEMPIGVAFLTIWGFLIVFFEKLIFKVPYPKVFR